MSGILGKPIPGYSECSFSLSIPKATIFEDRIDISFSILRRKSSAQDALAFDYCKIISKNQMEFICRPDKLFFPATEKNSGVKISINAPKRQVVFSGALLQIGFLTHTQKCIQATFTSAANGTLSFKHVQTGIMDASDQQRFLAVLDAYNKPKTPASCETHVTPVKTVSSGPIGVYLDAIDKEVTHLKTRGGRKHRVVNGRRISIRGGIYAYTFDLETELYLSDDAPIKIEANGGRSSTGSVLICEGFRIVTLLLDDLGPSVLSAYITVEPWKLLTSLADKLKSISKNDYIAAKLLNEGPKLSERKPLSTISTGQDTAIQRAFNEDITIVWGPPGTGKTHTMAEIAINNLIKNKTVLIVSHSNISVDGVVLKIAELMEKQGLQKALQDGKVLRYGYVRDENLSKNLYATSFNFALSRSSTLKARMESLSKKKDELKNTQYAEEHLSLDQEIKKVRIALKEEEHRYVNRANLIATTASKMYADSLFDGKKYDVVMFDEVSMAYVPQILCAASFAKSHFIGVGDFQQLAPISQSNAKQVLEKDLFTFLNITDTAGNVFFHPWLVMLNEQRRMHPQIAAFPSREFYHSLLLNHKSVHNSHTDILEKEPFSGAPLTLFDLTGTYCAAGKNSDNSRYNILSAITSFSIAAMAERENEKSIGIITPYAAQTRMIRAMIQDYRKNYPTNIACSTVHQFQGSERDVIIFDAVESIPSPKVGWLMSKDENHSIARLINVAITRAKGKLVLVGNRSFWEKRFEGTRHALYRLIKYLLEHGNIVDVQTTKMEAYYQHVDLGKGISLYTNSDQCITYLLEDLRKAKKKILISLPDSKLISSNSNVIWDALQDAYARKIECIIKVKEAQNLPNAWRTVSIISEKAISPLFIIDDKILWYGFPLSTGSFIEKNKGYITKLSIIARLTGENTIEMIKSLSDIESGGSMIMENNESGGTAAGFKRFVEEKEFCPQCKNAFKLTRGYVTKKYYLRCTNSQCNQTKPLDPRLVRWYMDSKHILCPIHRCPYTFCSGVYGQYLHCEYGHNIELTKI